MDQPMSQWTRDMALQWLGDLGLGAYVPQTMGWIQSGRHISDATPDDMERHLGMKVGRSSKSLAKRRENELVKFFDRTGCIGKSCHWPWAL